MCTYLQTTYICLKRIQNVTHQTSQDKRRLTTAWPACQAEAVQKVLTPPSQAAPVASPGDTQKLHKQLGGLRREANQSSLQLAHLHEERDKALVDLSRLEEVAPLVRREPGTNKRLVSSQSINNVHGCYVMVAIVTCDVLTDLL